ncbi:hypothetical protein F7725_019461 [Dissostichus mawsoni]|uniref:G-protein coupled receptors family 1 profile domain-containing protein n=1 Tax=Dissostichus mawsoni TaxID=36200 RepID=A0A7J5YJR7_DISMA|nr:hypothetical protein F7725_019461 [Dissostichus mawsoni]
MGHHAQVYAPPSQQVAVLLPECLIGFVSISVVAFSYIGVQRKVNQAAFFNNPQTTRLITSIIVTFFCPMDAILHHKRTWCVAAILLKNYGLWKFCLNSWNIFGALVFVNSYINPLLYAFALKKQVHSVRRKGTLQVCSMEQLNSSAVPFNISSTPGDPSPASWASIKLVSVVVVSICFLLGVPGNIAVIILKPNWQHLSSLSQSLMLNLAISDLICLLPLPLWIYTFVKGWTLGLVACKLLAYLMYCSLYSSLLTVTVLSVQRYLQVAHLQKIFDRVGKRRLLVLLWLVTMILSIPALVVRHVIKDQHGTDCHFQYSSQSQQVAVMLTETLTGFVAISVVAFSYIGLHRKVNQAAFFNNPQTTRLVTSIIVTFFVLWMPYHITNVLSVAAISLKNERFLKFCMDSWYTVSALVFVISSLNPLLYAFASKNMCTQVCSMEEFNSSLVPFNISSTPDHLSPASWVSIRLVPAVVLSICFLLGVPGNIAVIILKPNWQHLSSLSQSLMLNLAISDLICLLPCLCGFTP